MRRVAAIAVGLAAIAAFWVLAGGAGPTQSGERTYWVELDNAFGLVSGGDVKVAGVRAGSVKGFKLNENSYRALVQISITQQGFDNFRSDAFCESRPQSLIGEYFLDCQPGARGTLLKDNATIPVSHTSSTIAGDLVQNVLRLPYRQRLRIIINEFGAAVAGNGQNLNAAIQRGVPALRETDRVLALLAGQNKVLRDLTVNGDRVVGALAANHRDVGRWVSSTNRAATASASRRQALAATFHKLPAFLEQLRPAMAALGQAADAQTPALRNLDASSGQLNRFFNDLTPFSNASRPAFQTLAQTSTIGRQAVTAATPTIAELNRFATQTPEVGKNLRIILDHLNDPQYAVETDKRAAAQHTDGRANYTGLEALLQYVFDQSQAINVFDGEHYILKTSPSLDPKCGPYADAATVNKGGLPFYQQCSANKVSPKGPGLLGDPDISDNGRHYPTAHTSAQSTSAANVAQGAAGGGSTPAGSPAASSGNGAPAAPPVNVAKTLGQVLGQIPGLPALPGITTPGAGSGPTSPSASTGLLDYLLAP